MSYVDMHNSLFKGKRNLVGQIGNLNKYRFLNDSLFWFLINISLIYKKCNLLFISYISLQILEHYIY